MSIASAALQPRLLPSRYFFGQQQSQEVPIRPTFLLRPIRDYFVDSAHVRQVEASEVRLELTLGEFQTLRIVGVILGGPWYIERIEGPYSLLHGITSWKRSERCKKRST